MPKISALTALAAASFAVGDLLAIVDVSASQTKKTTIADVATYAWTAPALTGAITATGSASNFALHLSSSVTAVAGNAVGIYSHPTLIAAANNDVLSAFRAEPVFTPGAFTGLVPIGLRVIAFSTAGFTSPGSPAGIRVGVVTGTGATNGFGIMIEEPTGATNNYLIAHSTPTVFSVTGAGSMALAGLIISASSIKSSSPTAGIGYGTGAGGAQTQGTSKATTVVSNTITTAITMHNATLNADTTVAFTFTNSSIAATDTIIVDHVSAGTLGSYLCAATPAAGSALISVRNITAGNLGEAIVLRVTVIKSVSA